MSGRRSTSCAPKMASLDAVMGLRKSGAAAKPRDGLALFWTIPATGSVEMRIGGSQCGHVLPSVSDERCRLARVAAARRALSIGVGDRMAPVTACSAPLAAARKSPVSASAEGPVASCVLRAGEGVGVRAPLPPATLTCAFKCARAGVRACGVVLARISMRQRRHRACVLPSPRLCLHCPVGGRLSCSPATALDAIRASAA
jgi:hypothetical protein